MRSRRAPVTKILLAIQIIVYILMLFEPWRSLIYAYGVKYNPAIAFGHQYWRLVTPMFIHFGFSHIFFNSITLYYLGSQVEEIVGSLRFTLIYFASGIMGNLFSYQFSDAVSAGASTALFGLFAYYLAMDYLYPNNPYYHAMGQEYKVLLIMNIILNLLTPNIDIAGHAGGVIGGFLSTLVVNSDYHYKRRRLQIAGIIIYVLIAAFILYNQGCYNTFFIRLGLWRRPRLRGGYRI